MGRICLLRPGSPSVSASSPPAGRNPARLTVPPRNGSATYLSTTDASVTLAPMTPSGATGAASTGTAGAPAPKSSSTLMPSTLASFNATRRDGSESPASTLDTVCRVTPAISASCC
jgi:hypothetical protein